MNVSDITQYCLLVVFLLLGRTLGEDLGELKTEVTHEVQNCRIKSKNGDQLSMHYTGKLEDGTVFDSSIPRKRPLDFVIGTGRVIQGWEKGLLDMCEGEKRTLTIPYHMAYGERGFPPKIPPKATLVFDVELLKIVRKGEL